MVQGGRSEDFLPMTVEELRSRGWDAVDVVFVTGDAYVDHPSFAMAILGRCLEAAGFRVAILSQPDWRSCQPWRQFGRPRICFAVSAGNMDSMVNHYTSNRKRRNEDAYSPGGRIGLRPDRATLAYCQRAREAYPGVPVIAGGIEASLRRLAHYDYWSDKVRRSILMDAKPDLVVYGMGERVLVEIVRRLAAGEPVKNLRDLRGVAYRLGAKEPLPEGLVRAARPLGPTLLAPNSSCPSAIQESRPIEGEREANHCTSASGCLLPLMPVETVVLPSYEEVSASKEAFSRMTLLAYREANPYNGRRLVQYHGPEAVVINPPDLPLAEAEMDWIYALPFTRRAHPAYQEPIPALRVVETSIQIVRGCPGGCSFCSLSLHEGRFVQCRSERSILREVRRLVRSPGFSGIISDLGGPTANVYRMHCSRAELAARCRRLSCWHPTICPFFCLDHRPLLDLLRRLRRVRGIRRVLVASGVRMDLARRCPEYLEELVRYHVGGHLKVAPEHTDPKVLRLMQKPPIEEFEEFQRLFEQTSRQAGREQYLVPYFLAGHPGCDLASMIDLACYLKRRGLRPQQVQDFLPTPGTLSTCMYWTGLDPLTGQPVYVARSGRERRWQRALLQYWKPENYFDVRAALRAAGREDLIGNGPDCLIPTKPPPEASRQKKSARRSASAPPTALAGGADQFLRVADDFVDSVEENSGTSGSF
ncbi:MAG: YgiQ family radical SAM protein [Thermoguttaceae bacterium]|nr:YgiQ family radical SAM protein [Thermoguttaceae bacterium]MDW8036973.1 YgiQ family radical SAM protein [Thermoguttaceae bacterium]